MSSLKFYVIGDSSALLAFATVRRLDLLSAVFGRVGEPPAVWREVLAADLPPNKILREAFEEGDLFDLVELTQEAATLAARYAAAADLGEAEAIAVARYLSRPVLLDDLPARRLARGEGVAVIGSLGVLLRWKENGALAALRPVAEAMRESGRFFSRALLDEFYSRAGEG